MAYPFVTLRVRDVQFVFGVATSVCEPLLHIFIRLAAPGNLDFAVRIEVTDDLRDSVLYGEVFRFVRHGILEAACSGGYP